MSPTLSSRDRRLRVALVAEAAGGGVGRHVLDLAEALPSHGFDVLLVHGERRIGEGFGERLARHRDFGYATSAVDMTRAPGPSDLRSSRAVRRALRQFGRVDVLHGHSSKGGALARMIRWGTARKVVYTPHAFFTQDPTLGPLSRGVFRCAELALGVFTDRVVTVSSAETAHAAELGLPSHKVVQIENGVEYWDADELARTRTATRRRLELDEHDVVVGFVGRLSRQKAPDVALRVFRRLIDADPRLRPVMVGDGPEEESVTSLLRELGLESRIRRVSGALGREVMPAFDVFLLTSRYEGFPYVLLEALNAGCAIVSTDVGGAVDCVREGRNGFITECDDTELARCVLAVTTEPDRLQTMRAFSRALVSEFSVERMIARIADLYHSVHAHHPSAGR